ncbi:MAG: DUF2130 domain-containing protein [Afipia sp.]|nr:DUF2130 domain-containing protein [Afipia sp.]
MSDLEIVCPNCSHEIKLTESLAAPLIEETRKRFQQQLETKEAEFSQKELALRQQQEDVARAKDSFEDQVAARITAERAQIAASEAKKAREAAAADLEAKSKQLAELEQTLATNNQKLTEAQQAQADVLRKQRELDDQRRELELTIEKRVQASQAEILSKAKLEVEDALKLKLSEKDHQLLAMTKQIEDLKRRAEQSSQQAQGEALELELEALLRTKFPADIIEPVAKGEIGGDVIQRVNAALGDSAGIILWEFKRTKNWSDSWLSKLRDDQRAAKADFALIISQVLPKNVETFDLIDGVWVAHSRCAIPVAISLRQTLLAVASTRNTQQGQQTKMEQVYQYLTGPSFRRRIEAAIEKFGDMKDDLDRERKFMAKQWAKREGQITSVVETTAGMYGDLQGIAGKALPEIHSFDAPLLEAPK